MSVSKVTLTFKAEKTVNGALQVIPFPAAGGGSSTILTGSGATTSAARAAIQTQIDASQAVAQATAADVQDANSAFNS